MSGADIDIHLKQDAFANTTQSNTSVLPSMKTGMTQ